jgi:hypothetical protein
MQIGTVWKSVFASWPAAIPRKGVAVNNLGESLPFKAFMVGAEMVLLERSNPDTLGARYILLPYDQVANVKFVDPLSTQVFASMGLEGKLTT